MQEDIKVALPPPWSVEADFFKGQRYGGESPSPVFLHPTDTKNVMKAHLVEKYRAAKAAITAQRGEELQEVVAFHGTSPESMASIAKDGFRAVNPDPNATKGIKFGRGIYLSERPLTALPYSEGEPVLLACLVLIGKASSRPFERADIPKAPGENEYDSFYFNGMVVARCAAQVLPLYKIKLACDRKQACISLGKSAEADLPPSIEKLPVYYGLGARAVESAI